MENTMNIKGKYKYYVKNDGWEHYLFMVVKYKVDNTKKVYKTNFNITQFINDFQSIFFEDLKDTFRRTSRIYADYILNYGVMDMLRFTICKDIKKKHIVAKEKKETVEINDFIKNLTKQKWCEFTLPIDNELNLENMKKEIHDKMFKENSENKINEYQKSRKIKFRED